MKTLIKSLAAVALMSAGVASAQTAFTDTYRNGSSCLYSYNIRGLEPTTTGKYPVFIYTVGTYENHESNLAMAAVESMAKKGYVAATIEYPNGSFSGCSSFRDKADCAYSPSRAASAVAKICARGKADCSKGIVVAGFSQGSIMALLAKNYDTRVEAAYGMGLGTSYSGINVSSCTGYGNYRLPADRLRAVNGEEDGFMGGNSYSVRDQLREVTGLQGDAFAYSALRSNGSGWVMARNSQVSDGNADHCYQTIGGCTNTVDSAWRTGTAAWAMEPNLNWLTNFTRR